MSSRRKKQKQEHDGSIVAAEQETMKQKLSRHHGNAVVAMSGEVRVLKIGIKAAYPTRSKKTKSNTNTLHVGEGHLCSVGGYDTSSWNIRP